MSSGDHRQRAANAIDTLLAEHHKTLPGDPFITLPGSEVGYDVAHDRLYVTLRTLRNALAPEGQTVSYQELERRAAAGEFEAPARGPGGGTARPGPTPGSNGLPPAPRDHQDQLIFIPWRSCELQKPQPRVPILMRRESGYSTHSLEYVTGTYDPEFRPKQPWLTVGGDSLRDSGHLPLAWCYVSEVVKNSREVN